MSATTIKPERPVDNLKFTAFKTIVDSYETAVSLILKKKPVMGEPIVVPFYYTHVNDIDASTGEPRVTTELVFGIGSADINHPYIACSVNNSIADDMLVSDPDSSTGYITLREKFENIISQAADDVINIIIDDKDSSVLDKIVNAIINKSDIIENVIEEKVEDYLRWRPLTELL